MPNISQLDDTAFSVDSLRLDGGPVTMKLGGHEFIFEDGQWVVGKMFYNMHYASISPHKDLVTATVPIRAHHTSSPIVCSWISGAGWTERTGATAETVSESPGGE